MASNNLAIVKKALIDLGYGNQLQKGQYVNNSINVVPIKDRIQTFLDLEVQLKKQLPRSSATYKNTAQEVADITGLRGYKGSQGAVVFPNSDLADIAVKVVKGEGGAKTSIAQHETYSALCFAAKMHNDRTTYSLEELKAVSRFVKSSETDIDSLYNKKVTLEWKNSSMWQTEEFFKRNDLGAPNSYVIERQKEGPMTKFIYKKAAAYIKDLAKNSEFSLYAGLQTDKWNPGDIWIVHTSVTEDDFKDCKTIKKLNEIILQLFKKKKLIPVSLKQVKSPDNVAYRLENDGETNFFGKYIDVDLGIKNGISFTNLQGHLHYELVNNENIKGFAVVRPFTEKDISAEIKGKAAAGGKAGNAFMNKILKSIGTEPILTFKDIENMYKNKKVGVEGALEVFYNLVENSKLKTKLSFQKFSEQINKSYVKGSQGRLKKFLSAKLQTASLVSVLEKLKKPKLDEFMDKSITYAQSTIRGVSCVFIKVGK